MSTKTVKSLKKLDKNQKLLTDFFKLEMTKVIQKNKDEWNCIICGTNMGNNPRQLCGKYYCLYEKY